MKETHQTLTDAVFYILLALRRPNHGYGVVQQVEQMTGGRLILGPGTLYGALSQLTDFAKELERLEEMLRNSALMEEDAQ